MNERNEKMAAMLATDAPAARDMAFQLVVMAKIEQRRYRRGMTRNIALTLAATALLAMVMPGLESVFQQAGSSMNSWLTALLIAASMTLPWWMTRRA